MKLSVFFSADKYTSHGREDKSESSLDCGGAICYRGGTLWICLRWYCTIITIYSRNSPSLFSGGVSPACSYPRFIVTMYWIIREGRQHIRVLIKETALQLNTCITALYDDGQVSNGALIRITCTHIHRYNIQYIISSALNKCPPKNPLTLD